MSAIDWTFTRAPHGECVGIQTPTSHRLCAFMSLHSWWRIEREIGNEEIGHVDIHSINLWQEIRQAAPGERNDLRRTRRAWWRTWSRPCEEWGGFRQNWGSWSWRKTGIKTVSGRWGTVGKGEQMVNVLERKAEPKWRGTMNAAPGSGLNEVVGSHWRWVCTRHRPMSYGDFLSSVSDGLDRQECGGRRERQWVPELEGRQGQWQVGTDQVRRWIQRTWPLVGSRD